jgi:hypothetical protein
LTNQKNELPMASMFANGLGKQLAIFTRTVIIPRDQYRPEWFSPRVDIGQETYMQGPL